MDVWGVVFTRQARHRRPCRCQDWTCHTKCQHKNSSASTKTFVLHNAMITDFFHKLSPIQPEMGSTGAIISEKKKIHPTLINMLLISLEISSSRFCLYPAVPNPSCCRQCKSASLREGWSTSSAVHSARHFHQSPKRACRTLGSTPAQDKLDTIHWKRTSTWPQELTFRASSWIVVNHKDSPWEWKGRNWSGTDHAAVERDGVQSVEENVLDGSSLLFPVEALHFAPQELHTHPSLEHRLGIEGQCIQMRRLHVATQHTWRVLEELCRVNDGHMNHGFTNVGAVTSRSGRGPAFHRNSMGWAYRTPRWWWWCWWYDIEWRYPCVVVKIACHANVTKEHYNWITQPSTKSHDSGALGRTLSSCNFSLYITSFIWVSSRNRRFSSHRNRFWRALHLCCLSIQALGLSSSSDHTNSLQFIFQVLGHGFMALIWLPFFQRSCPPISLSSPMTSCLLWTPSIPRVSWSSSSSLIIDKCFFLLLLWSFWDVWNISPEQSWSLHLCFLTFAVLRLLQKSPPPFFWLSLQLLCHVAFRSLINNPFHTGLWWSLSTLFDPFGVSLDNCPWELWLPPVDSGPAFHPAFPCQPFDQNPELYLTLLLSFISSISFFLSTLTSFFLQKKMKTGIWSPFFGLISNGSATPHVRKCVRGPQVQRSSSNSSSPFSRSRSSLPPSSHPCFSLSGSQTLSVMLSNTAQIDIKNTRSWSMHPPVKQNKKHFGKPSWLFQYISRGSHHRSTSLCWDWLVTRTTTSHIAQCTECQYRSSKPPSLRNFCFRNATDNSDTHSWSSRISWHTQLTPSIIEFILLTLKVWMFLSPLHTTALVQIHMLVANLAPTQFSCASTSFLPNLQLCP